ncbi:MAG TPA: nicotinate-nucleotide--dimethylbenzimidazole phosphoribosyltransferase [Coriobacteriia bacterium]|nr:nicotinate-nucleotide--dimethylbenzimidazole phosphoribosyltransferase [Coriobacteriia bacterium]
MTEGMSFEDQLFYEIQAVTPVDEAYRSAAISRLDRLTKPPGSLGRLEELAAQVATVQRTDRPDASRKVVLLMAADHGVVAEGVSPYPQSVTAQMVANFSAGGAAINQIARTVGAEVRVTDVGVIGSALHFEGVSDRKIAQGTENMAHGPAMSRETCAQAVLVGIEAAREAGGQGFGLIATGDMGIGNSTAAAALTAVFAGISPESAAGRGTGLDDEGLLRKIEVIRRALDVNRVTDLDPLGVLAAVGGLEIAALAGVIIGAAEEGVCVVSDGYISGSAALAAVALCPACRGYLFPSHLSSEPGHALALAALGLEPVLELEMRLGEGTGAALAMGVIDAACRVLSGMSTFDEAGVAEAEG